MYCENCGKEIAEAENKITEKRPENSPFFRNVIYKL